MKKILALLLSAIMVAVIFTGCGSDLEKYAGTYVGKEGTILILNKDGTASYTQTNWSKIDTGAWEIEDDQIVVFDVDGLGYDIYADIKDSATVLLFKSDHSKWNDEVFVKAE